MNEATMAKTISISQNMYEQADAHKAKFIAQPGVNEEIVRLISSTKNEPQWMLEKRLQGLTLFLATPLPQWGPSLHELDFEKIVFFVDPNTTESDKWEDLPPEIKKTFDRLGIPEAEKKAFSGVGAQYDSSVVYHKLQQSLKDQGVIFENMDVAVQKYPDLVKKYFMSSCIPINDHKLIMLHAAVWSGGTFIYVPKGVKVDLPLQAYFRMNEQRGGQFEHTLIIVDEEAELHYIEGCSSPRYSTASLHAGCVELHILPGAKMTYSSIENWSKNVYNLNTKRALVHKNASVRWLNGNMGSCVTMLYPCSVLIGEGAHSESLGIAFAGKGQNQDTGSKVIHAAAHTTSLIQSKSISKDGGISTYRGLVKVMAKAGNTKAHVCCDALLLDNACTSNTYPSMDIKNKTGEIAHEATVSKIGEEQLFYLQSRGMNSKQALQMIVSGFIAPVVKALPLEYALELNKLIELEMEEL